MNRLLVSLCILIFALSASTAMAQRPARNINWVNSKIANVRGLQHKVLASQSLGHDVGYAVWTPPDYDASASKVRYPVIYFLHGAGGTEASDSGGFSSLIGGGIRAGTFPEAICVFPNGGMSGYRGAVESMIIDELIPLIDRDYQTKAKPAGRALAGFSMGGAGSVRLSILHPELFCAAGSWGGALSWRGSGEDSPLLPAAKSGVNTLKSNRFSLLTINGDQDRPEGFTPLNKILKPLGIPHKVVRLNDTKHNLGHYYTRSADTMLAFLAKQLQGDNAAVAAPKRTVRVLTIGNSFAGNACKYLKQIAADGDVEMVIGTANLGGCTLERHASLAKQSAADPGNKPYTRVVGSERTKLSLQEYLEGDNWDYVTVQQMSALSFRPETYHPHIDELVAIIRECAPDAELLIHQTWAYRTDSGLLQEWGMTQAEMHANIVSAYESVARKFDAKIIPVGSAFNRFRTTEGHRVVVPDPNYDFENPAYPNRPNQANSLVAGWYWDTKGKQPKLRIDFKHANVAGCYLAGLVWYEMLTGKDAREIKYTPRGVRNDDRSFLREVAHAVTQREPVQDKAQ